ncbi:isochorismatase [Fusibacter sp. 3D3]|uniref:isochorismatase n=1 Tax=Fusibacter sp. 3D3 TaxID=1048380 RepID=UPI0008572C60|nr:isochorismatase [Fusibacter sp. 3D3]GAU75570.1 isochorismatase [Fusibacter sp. 3D3]
MGYDILIPRGTTTTFDNDYLSSEKLYEFYHESIWDKRFGKVLDVEVVKGILVQN